MVGCWKMTWCYDEQKKIDFQIVYIFKKKNIGSFTQQDIKEVIRILRKYQNKKKYIVIPFLTLISNLAMERDNIPLMVSQNIIKIVMKMLLINYNDQTVQWIGHSCLWNICGSEVARPKMYKYLGVIMTSLERYFSHKKIVETILGCLSNIVLYPQNGKILPNLGIYASICKILDKYHDDIKIMAVLYGLIANLAINEQIDQQIVNKNIVYLILQSLEISNLNGDDKLVNNSVAALFNLHFCNNWKKQFTKGSGYEILNHIYDYLEEDNENILHLKEQIRLIFSKYLGEEFDDDLEIDKTTSLHLCVKFDYLDIMLYFLENRLFDKEVIDSEGNTILHIAIMEENDKMIQFITSIGLFKNIENNSGITVNNLVDMQSDNKKMKILVKQLNIGYNLFYSYKTDFIKTFWCLKYNIPVDLIDIFFSYIDISRYQLHKIVNKSLGIL